MKNLFILILSLLPLIGFAFEQQTQAQFPQAQFQSTSSYQSITSYTPQITEVGAINVYGSQQSSSHRSGPRKSSRPDLDEDPFSTPIGDTPWVLMILLIGFYILRKKWKRMHSLPL